MQGFVASLDAGQAPEIEVAKSDTMRKAGERLAFFCRATPAAGAADAPPPPLVGRDAVDFFYEQALAKKQLGQALGMADLAFGKFFWLLTPARRTTLKTWTEEVLAGGALVAAGAVAAVPVAKRRAHAKAKAKAQVRQQVDALFG